MNIKNNDLCCPFCKLEINNLRILNSHIMRNHINKMNINDRAIYEKEENNSLLSNLPLEIIILYFKEIKVKNLKLTTNSKKVFVSFYNQIEKVRSFNKNTDFNIYFEKVIPWREKNPKIANSKELCSIIFENEEDAKKLYQSMLEKNPYYKHDGKLSPFSKDFVGYKNLTEDEVIKARRNAFKCDNDDKLPNQLKYWLKKGLTDEQAKEKIKIFQTRFSKDICIKKYGEKEGLEIFNKRQEKWQASLNNKLPEEIERINRAKMCNGRGFSNISQKLFWEIYEIIKNDYKNIYFATLKDGIKDESGKNNEYFLLSENNYFLDFLVKDLRKIIEFDGDYWHGKKRGNQERDRLRDKAIKSMNYEIFHVSEKEYKLNPDNIVKECIKFIKNVF